MSAQPERRRFSHSTSGPEQAVRNRRRQDCARLRQRPLRAHQRPAIPMHPPTVASRPGPAARYCPLLGGLVWRLADVERHLIYHVFEILGAAFLCGIGDPLSLLTANHAFPGSAYAGVAKIGVWACSAFAALLGALTLLLSPPPVTEAQRAELDAAAGQDTSTWAREVLLRAAKRRGT